MKLIYETMEVDDFKSIQHLRIKLDRRNGLYFVAGDNRVEPDLESNGAGKSTIFDALCWMHFGKTPDGLRGPDLIPWKTSNSPVGKLTFLQDKKRRVLDRTARPGRILLDGREITQETLEAELRFNFDVFCQTILLPQEPENGLFFDLSSGQKLELLSTTLKLDRWDERAEKAKKKERDTANELLRLESLIDVLNQQGRSLEQTKADLDRQSERWEKERLDRQGVSEKELRELSKRFEAATCQKGEADLAYDGAVTELNALRRELYQLNDYIRANDAEIAKAEAGIKSAQEDRRRLQREIDALKKGKCVTCGQAWHDRTKLQELARARILAEDTSNPKVLEPLKKVNEDLITRQKRLRLAEETLAQKAEKARSALDAMLPRVAELKTRVELARKQQKAASTEANPYREQLQQLRRRQEKLADEITDTNRSRKIKNRRRERYEFLSRAFPDIKLGIVQELLQELELCVNALLPQVGLSGWMIKFDVERETKKGTIARGIDLRVLPYKRTQDQRVKFASWSGGEAQRLRLVGAVALADVLLRRAGVEVNLQILDEPTKGLSPKGVIHMAEFLAERADDLGRVILLADQTVIQSSAFSGTITVGRGSKGTQVVNASN